MQRAWIAPGMTGVQTAAQQLCRSPEDPVQHSRGNRNTGKPPLRTNPTTEALPDHASWELWMQQVSGETQSTNFSPSMILAQS